MPRGDGTGPEGMGAMTGRGAGYCTGYDNPGFAGNSRSLRGGGFFRRGMGRNMRRYSPRFWNYPPTPQFTSEDEKGFLTNEITHLKEEIQDLEKRLAELSK